MIPRGQIDFQWSDLFAGLLFPPQSTLPAQQFITLSVRSGFELLLSELQFPPGSQVLCSPLTIPGMLHILEAHQLQPIPVDLELSSLRVSLEQLKQALTPECKAVLITPLFGTRQHLLEISQWCTANNLLLIEDAAQGFSDTWKESDADVTLYSFGMIKTATAFGGGLILCKHNSLMDRLRSRQQLLPVQSTASYIKRILTGVILKICCSRILYPLLYRLTISAGVSMDQFLRRWTAGFSASELLPAIRHRPCRLLKRMVKHRLSLPLSSRLQQKEAAVKQMQQLAAHWKWIGQQADQHVHWIIPVLVEDPQSAIELLAQCGIDATQKGSQLILIPPPQHKPATLLQASEIQTQAIYIPVIKPSLLQKVLAISPDLSQ